MRTWVSLVIGLGLAAALAGACNAAGSQSSASTGSTTTTATQSSGAPSGEDAEARRRRLANEEAIARSQSMHDSNGISQTPPAGFDDESSQIPRDFAHCAMRNGNLVCGSALDAMDAVASHLGQ